MGSSFLNPLKVLDPVGNMISNKISSTPFVSKLIHEAPLSDTIAGKMTPGVEAGNDAYNARNPQPAGANLFTGQTPTLKDANTGYTDTPAGASNDTTAPGYGMNATPVNTTITPTAARQQIPGTVPGQVQGGANYGAAANNVTARIRNFGWGG